MFDPGRGRRSGRKYKSDAERMKQTMAELKGSKTEQNLWTAFAGESQARNKYTYFASKAKKDGYVQISKIFEETAANEKEHAEIWFKLLNGIGTTSPSCLRRSPRSKRSTRSATASCWPMWRADWCSPGMER